MTYEINPRFNPGSVTGGITQVAGSPTSPTDPGINPRFNPGVIPESGLKPGQSGSTVSSSSAKGQFVLPPGVTIPPYIPSELAAVWLNAYIDAGGTAGGTAAISAATNAIRQHPRYDYYFPGNRRDDGTFRFDELGYYLETQAFSDVFRDYGIDPAVFESMYGTLIGGDVSWQELQSRVEDVYTNLIERAPEVLQFYQQNFGGTSLQFEDVLAAALDPTIGQEILSQNISVSLVGGAALQAGFNVAAGFAEAVLNQGLGTFEEASAFFQEAASRIPILGVLAARHNDPDDEFNLEDFTAAALFNDPEERRRLLRLMRTSSTGFGTGGLFQTQGNRLTGLVTG